VRVVHYRRVFLIAMPEGRGRNTMEGRGRCKGACDKAAAAVSSSCMGHVTG
jgi:hypothetical protein